MSELRQQAIRGGLAKVCAQAAFLSLRLGTLVVLARLLDPKDFGLVGMVTVVTGVFGLFRDAGLSVATVQRPSITTEQISTLFWINMLVGGLLGLLSLAAAPALVAFYGEPQLFWVTVSIASGFVLNAAGVQHAALLQRQMRFSALAAVEVIATLISCGLGIYMGLAGYGYWALVGISVSQPAVATLCFWVIGAWLPGAPRWDASIRSMVGFGGTVSLNTLVVYVAFNAEKVLLGRFLGAEALGIYGRAYQLVSIPSDSLNGAIYLVAVSGLARLQGDPIRFRNFFLRAYSLVLTLTLPVTIASGLLANEIIFVVLGPKWQAAATSFRYLTPTVLALAVIGPMGWILFSSGRVVRSLRIALFIAPVVMVGYAIGLPFGLTGVAAGYSAAMMLLVVPVVVWATHGTPITPWDVWRATKPPLVSAITGAVIGYAVHSLTGPLTPFLRLVLSGTAVMLMYVWMLMYVMGQRDFYVNLISDLIGLKRQEEASPETRPTTVHAIEVNAATGALQADVPPVQGKSATDANTLDSLA